MPLRSLPLEGRLLQDIEVCGNGKRCTARIRTVDGAPPLYLSFANPTLDVEVSGKLQTTVCGEDDSALLVRYFPDESLRLEVCQIAFWGGEAEWVEHHRLYHEGLPIHWSAERGLIRLVPAE
jgi:hypothetical protein